MDERRLKAFEDMLAAIIKQYDDTTKKMAKLKAEGKEKTVTYRQLFANKLQLERFCPITGLMGFWMKRNNGKYRRHQLKVSCKWENDYGNQ